MKNLPIVLSSLALVGVIILFGMQLSGPKTGHSTTTTTGKATPNGEPASGALKVAYIQIDSFEANYEYLKQQRDAFSKRQEGMKQELQSSAQKLQSAVAEFQKKAQAGSITQAEAEAEEKRLTQMDRSLQSRSANLEDQLMKEQQDFNEKLRKLLDEFLADYNKDKKYDYILSYSVSSPFLYVNPAMDITNDVVKGMNDRGGKLDGGEKK